MHFAFACSKCKLQWNLKQIRKFSLKKMNSKTPSATDGHFSILSGPQWVNITLMFSLICAWMNGWVHNREAGDLRRHRAHYDVIVMNFSLLALCATKRSALMQWYTYYQFDPWNKRVKLSFRGQNSHQRKYIWKCRLRNVDYFDSTAMA